MPLGRSNHHRAPQMNAQTFSNNFTKSFYSEVMTECEWADRPVKVCRVNNDRGLNLVLAGESVKHPVECWQ